MTEKVTKLKRQIARLSFDEISELMKYVQKTKDRKYKQKHQEAKLKEYNRLRNLEPGIRVIIKETRDSLAGKIGTIDRHLGGKSQRTVVTFEEEINGSRMWRIPTSWLSDDLSELNLNRIKQNIGLGRVFNSVLSKL